MHRFYIISETHGLVAVADSQEHAEELSVIAAVNSGHTVYLHDRLTELDRDAAFRKRVREIANEATADIPHDKGNATANLIGKRLDEALSVVP